MLTLLLEATFDRPHAFDGGSSLFARVPLASDFPPASEGVSLPPAAFHLPASSVGAVDAPSECSAVPEAADFPDLLLPDGEGIEGGGPSNEENEAGDELVLWRVGATARTPCRRCVDPPGGRPGVVDEPLVGKNTPVPAVGGLVGLATVDHAGDNPCRPEKELLWGAVVDSSG